MMKERLATFGLEYRLLGYVCDECIILEWSRKEQAYLRINKRKSSGFTMDYLLCADGTLQAVYLRKNQILVLQKGKIIKLTFSNAANIGLAAEKKQRRLLSLRNVAFAPHLYKLDTANRLLIEELIDGKAILDSGLSKDEVVLRCFQVYLRLIDAAQVRRVEFKELFTIYHKKLSRIALGSRNKALESFIEKKMFDLKKLSINIDGDTYIYLSDIVHGDFNPSSNIFLSVDGEIKIIDWEHSTRGPVLFDIFYMLVHMRFGREKITEYLNSFSNKIPGYSDNPCANIVICYLLLMIIKLNLWKYKDQSKSKDLYRRLMMLDKVYSVLM